MKLIQSELLSQDEICPDIFRIQIKVPEIAGICQPGQFVHLKVTEGIDPLLRRPFSIHGASVEQGTLDLLYRVVGQGSRVMAGMKPGDRWSILGPLGNGFNLECDFDHAVIVAGGMGSAPVLFLIEKLLAMKKRITFLWGARVCDEIFGVKKLTDAGMDVRIATDDGSRGHHGFVTDLLSEFLKDHAPNDRMLGFVCGPEPMMAQVQKLALPTAFPWQVSMERHMACGVGVCMGCGITMTSGLMQMVCKDGPIFDLREVDFNG